MSDALLPQMSSSASSPNAEGCGLLRALIDHLPALVAYVDADLRYLVANRYYTDWFGLDVDQIEGNPVESVVGARYYAEIEPKLREALAGQRVQYEVCLRDRLGQERMLEVCYLPDRRSDGSVAGVFSMIYDATERKTAQDDLRVTRLRWQSLVENNPDSVMLVDRDSRILYVNRAGLHHSLEQLLGQRTVDFVEPERRAFFLEIYARAWDEKQTSDFETPVTLGGDIRWFFSRVAPMVLDGKTECLLVVSRDVTERKRAEESLRQSERRLQEAQRLEGLGLMAGGMAQEFNNMLAGILGNVELAQQECSQPECGTAQIVFDRLEQIRKIGLRAAERCKQMLAYAGKGRRIPRPTDLNQLVADMRPVLELSLPPDACLRLELEEDLPRVPADDSELRRAVMNLVVNAAEALESAPGTVTVRTGLCEVDAAFLRRHGLDGDVPCRRYVSLSVHDTGCGMTREARERIFEPFFSTKFTGRGLGLAAVQGIVRSHRGQITVESAPGAGSSFRILLPCTDDGCGSVKAACPTPVQFPPAR